MQKHKREISFKTKLMLSDILVEDFSYIHSKYDNRVGHCMCKSFTIIRKTSITEFNCLYIVKDAKGNLYRIISPLDLSEGTCFKTWVKNIGYHVFKHTPIKLKYTDVRILTAFELFSWRYKNGIL